MSNSISDSSKNLNSFKNVKSAINSSSGFSDGINLNDVTSNNSSNQLIGATETESTTFFSTANFTNITTQVGSIVEIPCSVHHIGEGKVSLLSTRADKPIKFWWNLWLATWPSVTPRKYWANVCIVNALRLWDHSHSTSCIWKFFSLNLWPFPNGLKRIIYWYQEHYSKDPLKQFLNVAQFFMSVESRVETVAEKSKRKARKEFSWKFFFNLKS